jgi:DNA replication protein DnaC
MWIFDSEEKSEAYMNNSLKRAKTKIAERRMRAQQHAEDVLLQLDKNAEWALVSRLIREKNVALGLGVGDETALEKELTQLTTRRAEILAAAQLTEADITPQYVCPLCSDTGYVNSVRCSCLNKELNKILFADSNVSSESDVFDASTETDEQNKETFNLCRKMCLKFGETRKKNILILGKTGTGKTFLLNCIANQYISQGVEVCYLTAYRLNQELLNYHLSSIEDKEVIMDSLCTVDVLIIDDLGTEPILKNVTQEYLFVVLNERKQRAKTTIVSSNLTPRQLQDRYEDRIFSRLYDDKDTARWQLMGDDKRVK